MKEIKYILAGTIFFILLTLMLPPLEFSLNLAYLFFIAGNVLLLLLVYCILKYGSASTKKFDKNTWYEDGVNEK